jgi:NADP-reducing hydrogenase subunit HndB
MSKLTFDDLKRVRHETASTMALRLGEPRAMITVHMGTCGIAAGAREVMQALLEEVAKSKRPDLRVLAAACLGSCSSEPNVTVAVEGSEPVVYQKMDAAKIRQVFQRHILNGEPLAEFALKK